MSYNIITIDVFEKQAKRLIKKYASLKNEIRVLVNELKKDPKQGTAIGHNCYKIRLSIASKNKGKSGGARVITNVLVTEEEVYLLSIYDKSEKESLSDKEVEVLLENIPR
jgi:hypothetical protein